MGYVHVYAEHNRDHDVYVVSGDTRIDDEDDCKEFVVAFERHFGSFAHKVDVIFVPGEFTLAPMLVEHWGRARHVVFERFFRLTVRIATNNDFSIEQATKAIKRKEVTPPAPDVETALVLMAHLRARAGL